jgi:hypothetical protein
MLAGVSGLRAVTLPPEAPRSPETVPAKMMAPQAQPDVSPYFDRAINDWETVSVRWHDFLREQES